MQVPALKLISGGQGRRESSLAWTGRTSAGESASEKASPAPTTKAALSRCRFERAISSRVREGLDDFHRSGEWTVLVPHLTVGPAGVTRVQAAETVTDDDLGFRP